MDVPNLNKEWNIIQGGIDFDNKKEIIKKLRFIRAKNCYIENLNLEINYYLNQFDDMILDNEILYLNDKIRGLIEEKKKHILETPQKIKFCSETEVLLIVDQVSTKHFDFSSRFLQILAWHDQSRFGPRPYYS